MVVVVSSVARRRVGRVNTLTHLVALLAGAVSAGCGPERVIHRIESGRFRIADIQALGGYYRYPRATHGLISLLGHDRAAYRYFAAEALQNHVSIGTSEHMLAACRALVDVLDDTKVATYSSTAYLGTGLAVAGSVRARALLTLTHGLIEDHGFDGDAWHRQLEEREERWRRMEGF